MSGILQQVTDTLIDLTKAAEGGAEVDGIRVAHRALRDQWEAAANDATEGGAEALDRFEAVAAALCVDAYRPALERMFRGADAEKELATAEEAKECLARARQAFADGDAQMTKRWFRLAELAVAMSDPEHPGASDPG